MGFEAAIFDMDGLLLDTERLSQDSFVEACAFYDVTFDSVFYPQLIGLDAKKGSDLLQVYLADTVSLVNFETKWQELYHDRLQQDIPVKYGVMELLIHLKEINLPRAVATSTHNKLAHEKLHRTGLAPMFDAVVTGDMVTNGKPHPDIFLMAAKALGVTVANCIAFEDSENGVRAAVSAGMSVVQVPDLVAPSVALRRLGHHVADDILQGAAHFGLHAKATASCPIP